jgi:polar amino acid transport system substrate-binding protein
MRRRPLNSMLAIAVLIALAMGGLPPIGRAQDAQRTQKWREMQTGPKPDWSWLAQLRFLTEADYPPFNYYDEEGRLAGFNVDLARAVCRELAVACEINTAEWRTLVPSLKSGEADAVIASVAITRKALGDVDFTDRYYTTPARFAGKAGGEIKEISVMALVNRKVAVVQGTSHEAFLRDFFERVKIKPYATAKETQDALKSGEADLVFGDAISLMFWLQGTDSNRCCEFKGESYAEPRYFGDGVGIAVRKGDTRLREVLDYALARIKVSGRYEELMLRYFPLPLY